MILRPGQVAVCIEHAYSVAVSGGFDPLHVGHIRYLKDARRQGSVLVVIVNGDRFLERKKGKPFMPLWDRMEIINSLWCVDYVCPWEEDTVDGVLKIIKPCAFAKGGDRTGPENIPEWDTCKELGIRIITGVGGGKERSSSELLAAWEAEKKN